MVNVDNKEELSDEMLVEKIRLDNRNLFAVVIDRYEKKLLRYAFNLVKNEHRAADIVQESFIKSYINIKSFNTNKKFSSWIYRIVHNEAMNSIKKYRREIPILDNDDFPSKDDVEGEFERKEVVEQVAKCLDEIPLIYAEPLELYYLEDKTYDEISDILHIPPGTVATRLRRVKILMRKICQTK